MKIILEYDPISGQITDKKGAACGAWLGAVGFDEERTSANKLAEAVTLKFAGFTKTEIVEMVNEGILD
jgi:hypothetical protein